MTDEPITLRFHLDVPCPWARPTSKSIRTVPHQVQLEADASHSAPNLRCSDLSPSLVARRP